jgi:hypothetical protein
VDGGEFLSEAIMEALEPSQEFLMEGEGYISLHAISVQPR